MIQDKKNLQYELKIIWNMVRINSEVSVFANSIHTGTHLTTTQEPIAFSLSS